MVSKQALLSDREWFKRNPQAVIRFRREHLHEFSALTHQGHQPPVFKPSFITDSREAATWVAVVDVLKLLQEQPETENNLSPWQLRIRVRTVPLRSAYQRSQARYELTHAVATELLNQELFQDALAEWQQAA